jgi:hypothetical protein
MLELLFYVLFLLLFVFGAWSLFSGWQKIFGKAESKACESSNSEITHQPSAFQFDVRGDSELDIGDLDEEAEHGEISQPSIDGSVFSLQKVSNDPSCMMEIANAERQRIEREHRSILEAVLQEVLSEQLTPFEQIYERYAERCNTRERGRRLDKPRVRDRVKVYMREMAVSGKLKRVMKGREYFYVVAESGW